MDVDELTFYCVDCGSVFTAPEIEKREIKPRIAYSYVLECPDCSGNSFEIYTDKRW